LSVLNSLPILAGLGRVLQSIVIVGCHFSHFRWSFHFTVDQTNALAQKICWSSLKEFFHTWIWNNPNVIVHQCSVNRSEVILSLSFCRTSRCCSLALATLPLTLADKVDAVVGDVDLVVTVINLAVVDVAVIDAVVDAVIVV